LREASSQYVENDGHLSIVPFKEDRPLWTEMVTRCRAAGLYHQHSWLELLNRAYGFSLHLVALKESSHIVAACVFARAKSPFVRRLVSLPFSDYCPPLSLDDGAARRLMKALVDQPLPGAALEVRGIRAADGWHYAQRFVNWTLSLENGLGSVEHELRSNFRRNLRRAARENIVINCGAGEDYLRRFYRMHLLTRRRLGLPAQPWRFFKLAREIFAPSSGLEIWVASRGGTDVAGAVLLNASNTVYYKWAARRPGDDSRANHLLLWSAIEDHCLRSIQIDLGRTDTSNHGLMRFKSELGAHAAPLPYCYYPKAPNEVSPEALRGGRKAIAEVWSHLPVFATRILGRAVYRYLA
jgi:hypothetical protein